MVRSSNSNTVGSSLTFSCGQGYTLTGVTTIVCQTDGSWSGTVPSCVEGEEGVVNGEGSHLVGGAVYRAYHRPVSVR